MTLVETVAKIKGRAVTDDEAKLFAFEQFGLLATHIRKEVWINLYDSERLSVRLINRLYRYFESKGLKVNLRCIPSDLIVNFDLEDFRKFKSVGSSTVQDLYRVARDLNIHFN